MYIRRRRRKARVAGHRASYREGLSFGILSFATVAVLALGSSVAAARIYGIDVIGGYALALAPVGILGTLSTAGEQVALVRELAKLPPRAPRVSALFIAVYAFSSLLTMVVALVVVGGAYVMLRGPIGHPEVFPPTFALVAGYVVVHNLSWNLDMVLAAFRAGRQLFWVRLSQPLSFLIFLVAAGLVSPSLWAITSATGASWLVALVVRLLAVREFMAWSVPRPALREGFTALPHFVRWGLKLTPWGAANGLGNEIGVVVVGAVAPIAAVGAYSRAWLLGSRFFDLTSRINEMLFPTLVERRAAGDVSGFDRATVDTLRYATTGLLLPAAAGGGAAHGVMSLFGAGFGQGADALAIVLIVPALATASGIQAHVLFAFDRPLAVSAIAFVRLFAIVLLSVVLTMRFGITGTAVAIAAGYGLDLALGAALVRRCLTTAVLVLWPLREIAAVLVAYAAGFIAARAIDDALGGVVGAVVALGGGAAVYLAAVTFGALNDRDRRALSSLAARFARRTG